MSQLAIRPGAGPGMSMCRFAKLRQVDWLREGVPLPRPQLQVVHGTVPPKCARNTLPALSGMLYRPALGDRPRLCPRCSPLAGLLRHWHSAQSLQRMPSSPPPPLSEFRGQPLPRTLCELIWSICSEASSFASASWTKSSIAILFASFSESASARSKASANCV